MCVNRNDENTGLFGYELNIPRSACFRNKFAKQEILENEIAL